MKQAILFLIIITIGFKSSAQIGGLSGSKLGSFCTDVVDHKKIEFEPGFFHARSSQYWNNNGDLKDIYSTDDSIKLVSRFYFRFTYGLWNRIELGVALSTDLALSQWGIRYEFLKREKYGMALISGINIPFGNRTIDQKVRATGNLMQAGFGLVGSYSFSNNFSIDFTGQYLHFLQETNDNDKGGIYINTDIGYYIMNHQLQFIGGLGFHNISNDIGSHQILTINPGVTIETGNNYIIVLSVPFDVYGRRESKNTAFTFALTLTFD